MLEPKPLSDFISNFPSLILILEQLQNVAKRNKNGKKKKQEKKKKEQKKKESSLVYTVAQWGRLRRL